MTQVDIRDDQFFIDGEPTYPGRTWRGHRIEGLLLNSRMVQGVFDDLNPETRSRWNYPDGPWDPQRNTRDFIAAMPTWREHGLISFDINFQGGSPIGYANEQPWHNSAFEADGTLRPDYAARMGRVLDRADELGMAPMVGLFYFGQDERLDDEAAVLRAADQAVDWLAERGDEHVLIEIANEIDNTNRWEHDILTPRRCPELIERVRQRSGGRFKVSISLCGGRVPDGQIIEACDYVLLHGNGVGEGRVAGQPYTGRSDPDGIRAMVDAVRDSPAYRGQPIVFNEDDHWDFQAADNNFLAAIGRYAGWGYFDWRTEGEDFDEGYQSVPADWGLSSDRKRKFFALVREITGA